MSKPDKKNPPKPREADEIKERGHEVAESLRTIYATDTGLPDLSKLEKRKSYRWLIAAIGVPLLVILLCVLAWTGFLYFKSFNGFSGKGLILAIEGPNQISLGEETTYFINYQNPLHEPLASVDIRVNFPSDFMPTSRNPETPDKTMVWRLGALAADENGTLTVKGRFIGALGTVSTIQAIASYRPASYSSDFEAMALKQVTYADTVMEGWVQVPEKAIPGDHISLIYHLTNKGQDALDKLKAQVVMPEGFSLDNSSSSQADVQGQTYSVGLPDMAAGSSTDIVLTGVFASGFGGQAKVQAQAGTLGGDGTFLPVQKAEAEFPVLAGDLNLDFVVNGSEAAQRSIAYGDTLQGTIGFENTADEPLKKVALHLKLESVDSGGSTTRPLPYQLIDWDKLAKTTSSTIKDQVLTWDWSRFPELKEIPQNGNGTFEVSLPIVSMATGTGMATVRATVLADIQGIGDTEIRRTIQMAPMVFKLKSDAALSAEARYFSEEGAPLGSGPLPPKVGQATRYRIFWTVDKHVHTLKDIVVTGELPRNVRFITTVTSTAGELAFDQASRNVSWRLNRLPAEVDEVSIQFDVELTPTASDDGKFVDLIGDTTFQAYDEDVQENLLQVSKAIDTDLQNDESAKGKGVVMK